MADNSIIDTIIKLLENVGFPIVATMMLYSSYNKQQQEIIKLLKRLINATLRESEVKEIERNSRTDNSD